MKPKKVIIILLVLLLIVTLYGCTTENKTAGVNKNTEVTYREIILNDVLEAEHITNIGLNKNNELIAYIAGDSRKYVVLDENTEAKKEVNIDFDGRASIFTLDNSNNMYILSEIPETNENKDIVKISKKLFSYNNGSNSITENNVIGELTDTTARSTEEITKKIRIDSKGNIYALKLGGKIEVFDSKFNSKKILDSTLYTDIDIDEEDNLLAIRRNIEERVLDKIDTSNYKIILSKEYDYNDLPRSIYYNKNTKSLYGISTGWIVKYDSNGNMVKRLLNTGELSDIEFIFDFVVDDSEEIYITADAEGSYKLIKYTTSSSETEIGTEKHDRRIEITIELTQDYGNKITKAAKKFGEKNPDVKVTVNLYPDLDWGQYNDKLNAELIAGKGPDILYLRGGEPIRTYMEKGMLVNLDEMIENDSEFNIEDYNTHIIDNSRYKDKLYTMPIDYYYFYCFVLNQELLDEKGVDVGEDLIWKDIYALSKKLNENSTEQIYVLPKIDDYMLFNWMVLSDLDYYIDWDKKEAKFNSEEFIEALKLFKAIKEDNVMHPNLEWIDIANDMHNDEDLKNIAMYTGQTHAYHYIRSIGSVFNGFNAISVPKGEYTGNREYGSEFLAINANSKHKELVWEFIKFMMTEEMQTIDSYIFQVHFHINNNASKRQIDELVFEEQEKNKEYLEKQGKYFATEGDVERLNKIIGNLNKPSMSEPFETIIYEEAQPFFNGEKTAEELAKQLQNKAEIYLNE
ncbi:ABC-type glycerol-3-phosphate transport system, substrate-binding protein [Proteiniborus ethanoligenes]|uniref:ABC-type glycerol-3-phosphate transport system, substrate-binding protein n=1 Tax=Proteiniborus ethanoligenes TaxID=415015 RepID=A0A1H3PBI3_9FIRM|nr:extracellular solute-binding protein [Proteiniborus ethanoligenes]SDY97749.1 ABC-type glycerol-3-phosphate transport system, substrate-binding protein [Proteiniborus ethanoligenes]